MQRIGRYEILEELGRGAMGAVYKARDPQIGRTVAIKTILISGIPAEQLAQYKQRFYREAQTAGQVSHPGIVTIHDIAEDEKGQPYLVMEFVDGVTLHRMLRPTHGSQAPELLPLDQALDLAAQVAEALDFAHRRGVVHRDIKPGNIMVTAEGRAKITDFGIAKFSDAEATHATTVLGTPAYMAPEQLRGGTVDARSDVFSLGAMLYWILTGHKPFPGDDVTSVSFKVVYTDPASPSQLVPPLPKDLDIVTSRCLAKNPSDRYQSAKQLAEDLRAIRAGKPVTTTLAQTHDDDPTVTTDRFNAAAADARQTARPAVPRRVAQRRLRIALAGTALALMVALAYFLWPHRPAGSGTSPAPSPPQPAAQEAAENLSASPAASPTSAASTGPAPSAGEAGSAAPPAARPANSTLEVECNFSFDTATLLVFVGSQKLVDTTLQGKRRLFRSRGGTYRVSGTVPAGAFPVRVRVTSDDRKEPFDQEAVIDGNFAAAGARKLIVEFPKKQLTLRWAEPKK